MSGRVERFEDLVAWQKARELTRRVYFLTGQCEFSRDYSLRDQIRTASVSIMSNITEGFERGHPREFRQYLCVSKGSCSEVRSQLYVALDAGYLTQSVFDEVHALAIEVGKILGGLRASVERRIATNSK